MTNFAASNLRVPAHIVEMVSFCACGSVGNFISTQIKVMGKSRVETACRDLLGWLLILPVLKHPHPLEANMGFERSRDLCQIINSSIELANMFAIIDGN